MPEGAEEATYYENLIVQRLEGGVGLIRINRPDRRNALNQATLKELAHAARGFDLDDTVARVVTAFPYGNALGTFTLVGPSRMRYPAALTIAHEFRSALARPFQEPEPAS